MSSNSHTGPMEFELSIYDLCTHQAMFHDERGCGHFVRRRCRAESESLREIGELVGDLDYAAVAQRIRRRRSARIARAECNLATEMLNALLAKNLGV